MFTGIVQQVGRVVSVADGDGDRRVVIGADAHWCGGLAAGDSVAVNGVCLTVTDLDDGRFAADVSRETLARTTLGRFTAGTRVNLERALRAGDPLGGHLVSGHVDAVTRVRAVRRDGRSWRLQFDLPPELAHLVAPKGSACIDGTSLTVNEVERDRFGVNIVPHTMEMTIVGAYLPDTIVNLEADLLARYVARVLGREHDERAD